MASSNPAMRAADVQPSVQRVEQRQRQQQPVIVAFVRQRGYALRAAASASSCRSSMSSAIISSEVEMARAGVGAERMETGDGGARVLERVSPADRAAIP